MHIDLQHNRKKENMWLTDIQQRIKLFINYYILYFLYILLLFNITNLLLFNII